MPRPPSSIYLFGILRAGTVLAGAAGAVRVGAAEFGPLRLLTEGDLAAVVSDITLPDGTTLQALLEEPEQVQALVLHHHQMLETIADQATALPLRFGSLFQTEEAVRDTLAGGYDRFLQSLDDIDGAVEWGLKVFCDRARLGAWLRGTNAELATFRADLSEASAGKRFFLERRLENLIGEEVARAIDRCLEHTIRRIGLHCRRSTRIKLRSAQLDGEAAEIVLNGAFLVDRDGEDGFLAAVEELRRAYSDFGFGYHTTGPWPAYSFVQSKLSGDGDAA